MRSLIAVFVAAGLTCAAAPAWADALIMGGQKVPCPVPLEVGEEEILAPLLPGLERLGSTVTVSDAVATIKTADGHTVRLKPGSAAAQVDGKAQPLKAAPKRAGDVWLVPAQSLARLLGAHVRFDEASRTLFLHHRVTEITVEPSAGGLRLRVACTGALAYTAGALKPFQDRPPRIYLDIEHADLAGPERSIEVNRGGVIALRAAQHWLNPDIVRVVLDLKRPLEYRHRTQDDGRTIVVEIATPAYEPAAVFGVEVGAWGERAAEIRVKAQGPIAAYARADKDPKRLSFFLDNAVPPNPLPQVTGKHSLLQDVILAAGEGAADPIRLEVALNRKGAYAMSPLDDGLRIVVGALQLSDVHVVLDPGHGGVFTGAQGRSLGLNEKEVNLDVATRAANLLREAGARVTMTRETDTTLVPIDTTNGETRRASNKKDLLARVALAERLGADVFLSIHVNSCDKPNTQSGSSTWYWGEGNRPLARAMQASLVKHLGLRDAGIHEREFVVCKYPRMPAALAELAYINHDREERLLADSEVRDRCAQAILDGLRTFVEGGALLDSQVVRAGQGAPPPPPAVEAPAERGAAPDEPDADTNPVGPEGDAG